MKTYLEIGIGFIFVASVTALVFVFANTKPTVHQPEALLTKDGCTIYKWYDRGERMYYTKCEDGVSPTLSR